MSTLAMPVTLTEDATAAAWIAQHVPDLSGRVAVVTGANSGLGLETSWALASKGAHVVMACRNPQKAQQAEAEVRRQVPGASIELAALDLASLASVAAFAERYMGSRDRLDLLFNNAGVMAIPHHETADGFEMQLGTNHLGHFALTGRLLPLLRRTPGSRVVTTSSLAHLFGRMRYDDLQGRGRYSRWEAYGQSKLANLLFAFELDRRLKAAGGDVKSVAAHPGYAHTGLQHTSTSLSDSRLEALFYQWFQPMIAQSSVMGSLPQLLAAVDPEARGGELYGPKDLGHMRGLPAQHAPAPQARNREVASRLWEVSSELTGVDYHLAGAV